MDVKMIDKLKDKLCDELETVSRKTTMSSSDLDSIHKLVLSIEKLMKIEEMEGESEYSQRSYGMMPNSMRGGNWDAKGSYARGYDNDNSYANDYSGRRHFVRGHYSRDDGTAMIREKIETMMNDNQISGNDRRILEKAMDIIG